MHCNLRPLDAVPVVIRFYYEAHTKDEVGQPIYCCLNLVKIIPQPSATRDSCSRSLGQILQLRQ